MVGRVKEGWGVLGGWVLGVGGGIEGRGIRRDKERDKFRGTGRKREKEKKLWRVCVALVVYLGKLGVLIVCVREEEAC